VKEKKKGKKKARSMRGGKNEGVRTREVKQREKKEERGGQRGI